MHLSAQLEGYQCLPGHANPRYVLCIQPNCKEKKKIVCEQLCVPYYHKNHKTIELASVQDFFSKFLHLEQPMLHDSLEESIETIRVLQKEINLLIDGIVEKIYNHFGRFSFKATKLAQEFQYQQTMERIQGLPRDLLEVASISEQLIKIKLIKPLEPLQLDGSLKELIQKLAGFSIGRHDAQSAKPEDRVNFFSSHTKVLQTQYEVWCLAMGQQNILASGGDDRKVSIWSVDDGQMLWETKKHKKSITSISFSPDFTTLASASQDGTLKFWNMHSKKLIKKIRAHEEPISSIAYHINNRIIVTASWDRTIKIWDLELEEQPNNVLVGHSDIIYTVTYSPQCEYLVSCGLDCTIRYWDVQALIQDGEALTGHNKRVDWITFSPNGRLLASCSSLEKLIILWDPKSRELMWSIKAGHDPYRIVFSPDSKLLVSASRDIRVFDTISRLQVGDPMHGHKHWLLGLKFSTDGRFLISGCIDKTIKIYGLPK